MSTLTTHSPDDQARTAPPDPADFNTAQNATPARGRQSRVVLACLWVASFAVFPAAVAWLRELRIIGGTTPLVGSAFGLTWLLGAALGAWLAARRPGPGRSASGLIFIAMGMWMLIQPALFPQTRSLAEALMTGGHSPALALTLAALALCLAPSILSGAAVSAFVGAQSSLADPDARGLAAVGPVLGAASLIFLIVASGVAVGAMPANVTLFATHGLDMIHLAAGALILAAGAVTHVRISQLHYAHAEPPTEPAQPIQIPALKLLAPASFSCAAGLLLALLLVAGKRALTLSLGPESMIGSMVVVSICAALALGAAVIRKNSPAPALFTKAAFLAGPITALTMIALLKTSNWTAALDSLLTRDSETYILALGGRLLLALVAIGPGAMAGAMAVFAAPALFASSLARRQIGISILPILLGAAAGLALASQRLLPRLGVTETIALVSALNSALAACAHIGFSQARLGRRLAVACALAAPAFVAPALLPILPRSIQPDPPNRSLTLLGHFPSVIHANPRSALVLTSGLEAIRDALGAHGLDRVESVDDPKIHLLAGKESYDIIINEPRPPHWPGGAALMTTDFYKLARTRLNPDGLFVQWIGVKGLPDDAALAVLSSFNEVFPYSTLFSLSDAEVALIGSPSPFGHDPATLVARMLERLAAPGVAEFMARRGDPGVPELLSRQMLTKTLSPRPFVEATNLNTEMFPSLEARAQVGAHTGQIGRVWELLDRRAMSPARAGLWIAALPPERLPDDAGFKSVLDSLNDKGDVFPRAAVAWTQLWSRALPDSVEARLARSRLPWPNLRARIEILQRPDLAESPAAVNLSARMLRDQFTFERSWAFQPDIQPARDAFMAVSARLPIERAHAELTLGDLALDAGDPAQALQRYRAAYAAAQATGAPPDRPITGYDILSRMAEAFIDLGQYEQVATTLHAIKPADLEGHHSDHLKRRINLSRLRQRLDSAPPRPPQPATSDPQAPRP